MKILARCAAALFLLAGLAFSGVWAQEADTYGNKSSGPIIILPPPHRDVDGGLDGTQYFPGREYRSGDGWWNLACGADGGTCQLLPARLDVAAHPLSQCDGSDVPGQSLRFTPVPDGSLLVFKPFRAPADALVFEAGAVETWRIARSMRTPGTMEGELALADGRLLRFVPMLLTSPELALVELELVLDGQRQTLGTLAAFDMAGNPFSFRPEDYVRWIGDLDRDGKPDFVVNFSSVDFSQVFALFLSSLAKPGEIVGLAGHFSYFPEDDLGC